MNIKILFREEFQNSAHNTIFHPDFHARYMYGRWGEGLKIYEGAMNRLPGHLYGTLNFYSLDLLFKQVCISFVINTFKVRNKRTWLGRLTRPLPAPALGDRSSVGRDR